MNIAMLLSPKCDVSYMNKDDTVRQGLEKFRIHKYTAVPVLENDGTYYGVVRDKDFLTHIVDKNEYSMKELESVKINQLIEKNGNPAVNIGSSLQELIDRIKNWNFVPVVDSRNVFVGIITRKSVINYLMQFIKEPVLSGEE